MTRWFITHAALTITTTPTSAKAKVYASALGVGGSVQGAVQGTVNLFIHPVQSAKGLWRMANNTPEENTIDYAMSMIQYADLPEPLQSYAVEGHFLTDLGMTLAPFKCHIKSTGLKFSAELPAHTQVVGISFSRMGSNLVKKASEFKLTHSIETMTKSSDYKAISKLTDEELIKSVTNPKEYKMINPNT